jgi:hypothetical protein
MPVDDQIAFCRAAYDGLCALYGRQNIVCGAIHVDEVHAYEDGTGAHTSRVHLHALGVPYVPEKGINGKTFLTRATYAKTNEAMDAVCQQVLGYAYQDGSKQKSKGTVEQLKQGRKNALAESIQRKMELEMERTRRLAALDEEVSAEREKRLQELNQELERAKEAARADVAKIVERGELAEAQSAEWLVRMQGQKKRLGAEIEELKGQIEELKGQSDVLAMSEYLLENTSVYFAACDLCSQQNQEEKERAYEDYER